MGKTTTERPAPRQAPRKGAGRKRFPIPYAAKAEAVVGRTVATEHGTRPVATVHAFTVAHGGPTLETLANRFRRQLTRLGKELRPGAPVSFGMAIEPRDLNGGYDLVIWDRYAGKTVTPSR